MVRDGAGTTDAITAIMMEVFKAAAVIYAMALVVLMFVTLLSWRPRHHS